MNLGPYTYVTLSMHTGEQPSLKISFHTADLWIRSSVIDEQRPYLTISTPEAAMSLSTTGDGTVTDDDLATARKLADMAAQYLADCERLHAAQAAPSPAASHEAA